MTRLNREPEVLRMAAELGLPYKLDPVGEIVRFCIGKIAEWLDEALPVQTIGELEQLVCDRLQLHVEEFRSDKELRALVARYTRLGEPAFKALLDDFDPTTFATLMRRENVTESAADRYVAVIDCRGAKASRRFFSRWHEIAHRLTMIRQLELPYHRSTDKPPLERLMDHIAGEVGFFPPLFVPTLRACMAKQSYLTFEAIEAVRHRFCPTASFHATLIACSNGVTIPVVHIEAGMGLKKEEQQLLHTGQGQLFAVAKPKAKLRALIAASNPTAREAGLRIDRNMTVPPGSVISKLFANGQSSGADVVATERLDLWRHSDGSAVGCGDVRVEARRLTNNVIATIQPVRRSVRRRTSICISA